MRSRGAERGANDHRHRALSSYTQPLSLRLNGTSGHAGRRLAAFRDCLLSSRSRVRVAVGAQVNEYFSLLISSLGDLLRSIARRQSLLLGVEPRRWAADRAHQAKRWSRISAAGVGSHREPNGEPTACGEAGSSWLLLSPGRPARSAAGPYQRCLAGGQRSAPDVVSQRAGRRLRVRPRRQGKPDPGGEI